MSFGEVGETGEQCTSGFASGAHGVGQFDKTVLLERMVHLYNVEWSVSSTGQILVADVDKALRQFARNAAVLSQFHFYRTDIELTVRMNSNQFFYGAIMVTMWPSNATGQRLDERAVLDPIIISASSAESVIKTWTYSWPMAWKLTDTTEVDNYPTWLSLDVVAPLTQAKIDMPDSVTIQVWGRFKNISLAYPYGPTSADRPQSQTGSFPQVRYVSKNRSKHPAEDPSRSGRSGSNTVDQAISAISSITVGDAVSSVKSLASFVTENWGAVAGALALLDKPDRIDCQDSMIVEGSIDLFAADIPDTNPCISLYKARYVDPGWGRMPMTKNWTVSDYARIPGLRSTYSTFNARGDFVKYRMLSLPELPTDQKIPVDFAWAQSLLWRGSFKVCLMFFTSSFISARFVVSYINDYTYPNGYPLDYSSGLSKVINVKGDTIDTFTLPWLSATWWSSQSTPQIKIEVDSDISSVDAAADPQIYMLVWVAGGDDIQFAYPRVVPAHEWGGGTVPHDQPQSAPGSMFQKTFPPLVENVYYDIDRGFCTSENLGPITDICKRYTVLPQVLSGPVQNGFTSSDLDLDTSTYSDPLYPRHYRFRQTLFGTWRQAFLFRSGGYRWRFFGDGTQYNWSVVAHGENRGDTGQLVTNYITPFDKINRLTIPQLSKFPFSVLGMPTSLLDIVTDDDSHGEDADHPFYLAARDDLQFGYPILPSVFPVQSNLKGKEKETPRLRQTPTTTIRSGKSTSGFTHI